MMHAIGSNCGAKLAIRAVCVIALIGAFAADAAAAAAKAKNQIVQQPVCTTVASKHILFIMFLTAPPRVHDPDWSLQSTTTMEFETCNACEAAAKSIVASIAETPTINVAGWCFPKQPEEFSADALRLENKETKKEYGSVPQTPPLQLKR